MKAQRGEAGCMHCNEKCPDIMYATGPQAWHINCHTYLPVCPACHAAGKK